MKKRFLVFVSVFLIMAMLPGCGIKKENDPTDTAPQSAADDVFFGVMPTVVNTVEYTLYRNIFFNDQKAEYSGKTAEKEGTFATIYDAYNEVTRYYVWGYNDQTKCCDWQWELKIDDTSDLPSNGSLIKVSGVYEVNEDALDKLWIIHPQITVKKLFAPREYDFDMQSMDNTLERVQCANIVYKKTAFEGKTVCGYGRIKDENTLEDPYYDGSWSIGIAGDYDLPAFGTLVLVSGTIRDGVISDCEIMPNTQY